MPLIFSACTVTHAPRSKQICQPVLQRMVEDVAALINTALAKPDPKKMQMWFGKNFTGGTRGASERTLITQTERLAEWLSTHQPIQFITKDAPGTMAFADQSNDTSEIFLGHGFAQSRWSWGERVCTLIHEFTHKAIATADVQLGTKHGMDGMQPVMSYGMACLTLADDGALYSKALQNAENWGYYLCTYRTEAGLAKDASDPNWKYLAKKDWISGRTAYIEDRAGHVDDPLFFDSTGRLLNERLKRTPSIGVAVSVPVPDGAPERIPCECGQVFAASFLHKQHLGSCHATAIRTQFLVPAGRSQAEHLRLAAIRARQLEQEEDA